METMEPRAVTGELEELRPVAPFTSPFGFMTGICATAKNELAEKITPTQKYDALIPQFFGYNRRI
jgi:hypothetical protein